MTASELKDLHEQAQPKSYFFTRDTMRFFGDTMKNYGVRRAVASTWTRKNVPAWELYRKSPVSGGLCNSHFFTLDGHHLPGAERVGEE